MTIVKVYVDGIKYFELDSIEPLSIKKELPLSKFNQIYSFYIYYQSQRGHYRLLENSKYFIYKDDERYLYEYRKKSMIKIDDLTFSHNQTIKIFMKTTNDYFIYNIFIDKNINKYILSETNLTKNELNDKLFPYHIVNVKFIEREECGKIIQIEMDVDYIFKKNLIYRLKKYIYKKIHALQND
jgi:hypothetical protein